MAKHAESGRGNHVLGAQGFTIFDKGFEVAVAILQLPDERVEGLDSDLFHEPVRIFDKQAERKGRGWFPLDVLGREISLQGVDFHRIKMPCAARAEKHPFGHLIPPELHGFSQNGIIDSELFGVGGGGQAIGPGANNEELICQHRAHCPPGANSRRNNSASAR